MYNIINIIITYIQHKIFFPAYFFESVCEFAKIWHGTEGSEHTGQDGRLEFQLRDDQYKHIGETGECYMNTHQLLYDCNLNWLKFI